MPLRSTPHPLRAALLRRVAAAAILGLFTSVALATWLALRPATTFTFNHSLGVNSAPPGSPEYRSIYRFADEYRPGFRRIQVNALAEPIDALVASRLKDELTAKDRTPQYPNKNTSSRTPQRPVWFPWVPTPTTEPLNDLSGRAVGWPWLCLHSSSTQATPTSTPKPSGSIRILSSSWYPTSRGFYTSDPDVGTTPILPLWPGLIGNTALFAAPWLILLALPPLIRARLRKRRHHCPTCGYDLASITPGSPCPECGSVSSAQSNEPQGLYEPRAKYEAVVTMHSRPPTPSDAQFCTMPRFRLLILCLTLGLTTTICIALQSARASHIFIDSSPKLALARPAAAPATQLPDSICYTHERRFASEMWELTYVAVPGYPTPPLAADLPDDAPAWVARRLRAFLTCGPNNWPDFPPASTGLVCHSVVDIERFGWPRPALWFSSCIQQPFTGSGPAPGWIVEGAVRVPGATRAGCALPLYLPSRPDWPGLIIDTLVWAIPYALMFFGTLRLLHARRHRRGQCPACGYDLSATPPANPCPECGRATC